MKTVTEAWARKQIAHYTALHELKLVEMFEEVLHMLTLSVEGIDE
jgi:hypothetical protein